MRKARSAKQLVYLMKLAIQSQLQGKFKRIRVTAISNPICVLFELLWQVGDEKKESANTVYI